MNIQEVRSNFPILNKKINNQDLIYLDSAATTHRPSSVVNSMRDYYENKNSNIHRGLHTLAYESTVLWEEAHEKVASFLNASSSEEIIFTKNTTESLNLVANTYGRQFLKQGDVIAITEMEHHSNIVPWQQLAKEKKLKLEWIPVLDNFELDLGYLDYLIRKYKRRFKILSVSHVSNVLGVTNDIKSLAKRIHSIGGIICVDAAQSVSHLAIDVQELDCDFLVFSGHKIYGPMGIGVLYGKKDILENMDPWMSGGDTVKKVSKTGVEWAGLPTKFEAGTPNVAGAVGLAEALFWFNKYGWLQIRENERKLMQIALTGLLSMCNVEIFGPSDVDSRVGVLSFKIDKMHPHDIASLLDEKGIAIRAGFHCAEPLHTSFDFGPSARISFGIYNTPEEVKYFINSLRSVSNKFLR